MSSFSGDEFNVTMTRKMVIFHVKVDLSNFTHIFEEQNPINHYLSEMQIPDKLAKGKSKISSYTSSSVVDRFKLSICTMADPVT